MPNSVLWVCLVAVWLFVLVPMVIKGRPQILKSTDAARKTRLLHRGGSRATTASGNRRRSSARHPHDPSWKSSRRSTTATLEKDADVEAADDAEVDEAKPSTRMRRSGDAKVEKPVAESVDDDIQVAETVLDEAEDGLVDGDETAETGDDIEAEAGVEHVDTTEDEADATSEAAEHDDDFEDVDSEYEDAEDELDDDTDHADADADYDDAEYDDAEYEDVADELDEDEYDDYARGSRHTDAPSAVDEDETAETDDAEVDEVEDSRPAARSSSSRRSGRSIYSSDKERELKYRERQRVTLGLFVLVLLAIVAGFVVGMPGWVATGVLGLLLVGYLAYLRRAVKTEQQIRAQRLARAKRSARAEEERRRRAAAVPEFAAAPPPPRLRRPGGATVLEIDDEDPVFDHIPPFQRRRMDREDLQYRRVG
nr:gephyrin-like molybdotransferase receptor GlpR [Gordonia sp. LAM0048]